MRGRTFPIRGRVATIGRRASIWLRIAVALVSGGLLPAAQLAPEKAAGTLSRKLILGYQGWFACPGDPGDRHDWSHWFDGTNVAVEMLPDMTEVPANERCKTTLQSRDGKPIYVFSSQNEQTVDRHFAWMEHYGLDGVALQRFATHLRTPSQLAELDRVAKNVRNAAEHHNRVFFIMYDLSGMPISELPIVAADWARMEKEGLTASPSYLHHRGHPVLALWGLGFAHRPMAPADADVLLTELRNVSQGYGGITVVGGVPTYWREGNRDASQDPGWRQIWPKLGVISPWTVSRYGTSNEVDKFAASTLLRDLEEAKRLGVDYMPVAFPGTSGGHQVRAKTGQVGATGNDIPRACGTFFWRQIYDFLSDGASMLYVAMFDEVDEGTAMFKVLPSATQAPLSPWFLALDADGCHLPSDWYLRLAGAATVALHGGHFVSSSMPLALSANSQPK